MNDYNTENNKVDCFFDAFDGWVRYDLIKMKNVEIRRRQNIIDPIVQRLQRRLVS